MGKPLFGSQQQLTKNIVLVMSLVILTISLFISKSAFCCGGPAVYDLDAPMHPLDNLLEQLLTSQSDYELGTRDEFLFLYPFKLEKQKEIEPLWTLVYMNNTESFRQPALELFESALMRGDWETAETEAKQIINQVIDMPSAVADMYQPAFIEALEFLELQPYLKDVNLHLVKSVFWDSSARQESNKLPQDLQDILEIRTLDRQKVDEIIAAKPHHPRAATLRFISLRNEFAHKVPDGWVYDIRKKVHKDTWRELERSADLWLKDYPQHPLADLVLFWKTRIYYFEGNRQRAWNQLLSIYPRRLPRVLYEMRYMLMNYEAPLVENLDKIKDPILFSALLPSLDINSEQWSKWWELSEMNFLRPWASNLQERLLAKTIREGYFAQLPHSFPKQPRNPTSLWGKLRALSLMKTCQWDNAAKQLFSLAADKEQAILAAAYHLRRGKIALAAQVIDLPEDVRHYLIRVMLDDDGLHVLELSKNPILKREALFEQGVRFAEKGKWTEAARIIRATDIPNKAFWEKAAALSADTRAAGRLEWARFLKNNNGKLFYGNDSAWYRSLSWRIRRVSDNQQRVAKRSKNDSQQAPAPMGEAGKQMCSHDFPWTSEHEQDAVTQHLARTAEMWLALQVYADWLSTSKPSREMSVVLKEADACYNWLINWDSTNSHFWNNYLVDQSAIKQIREAGKRL